MSKRSFIVHDFEGVESTNYVRMGDIPNHLIPNRLSKVEEWLEPRVTDSYLMLTKTVIFKNEKDAMMFKLGFKYESN